LVETGLGLVLFVFAGVMGGTAVEDIASAVAGGVRRNTAFEGERVDGDC
jgi:hypothetical protein